MLPAIAFNATLIHSTGFGSIMLTQLLTMHQRNLVVVHLLHSSPTCDVFSSYHLKIFVPLDISQYKEPEGIKFVD